MNCITESKEKFLIVTEKTVKRCLAEISFLNAKYLSREENAMFSLICSLQNRDYITKMKRQGSSVLDS